LYYIAVHSVVMGQKGHVGVWVLKHYCNSKYVCAVIGHIVTIENVLAVSIRSNVLW